MIDISGKWYYDGHKEREITIDNASENSWHSKNGKSFFQYEHQFTDPNQKGIFVNVQKFTAINENTLEQKLMGYRYDPELEDWIQFERTDILKRV